MGRESLSHHPQSDVAERVAQWRRWRQEARRTKGCRVVLEE